jgi:hypothetical protein
MVCDKEESAEGDEVVIDRDVGGLPVVVFTDFDESS